MNQAVMGPSGYRNATPYDRENECGPPPLSVEDRADITILKTLIEAHETLRGALLALPDVRHWALASMRVPSSSLDWINSELSFLHSAVHLIETGKDRP